MKTENEEKLFAKYPILFSEPLPYGIECSDGWYDLIDELSNTFEEINKEKPYIKASQVKEKFGTLRFYFDYLSKDDDEVLNERIHKALAKAEMDSSSICEACSKPGEIEIVNGWVAVRCLDCSKVPSKDKLVRFYLHGCRTPANHYLISLIEEDDNDFLEAQHDYIQWVFPLSEPSKFNPDAPLISQEFLSRLDEVKPKMLLMYNRMLEFYGLAYRENGPEYSQNEQLVAIRPLTWLDPKNHNVLRLTRIMTSLSLVGLTSHAIGLQEFLLEQIKGKKEFEVTEKFWREAIK